MKDYFVDQADDQRWADTEIFQSLDTLNDAHLGAPSPEMDFIFRRWRR